jgi:hypothetical protein
MGVNFMKKKIKKNLKKVTHKEMKKVKGGTVLQIIGLTDENDCGVAHATPKKPKLSKLHS